MSLRKHKQRLTRLGFPRVSGDEPATRGRDVPGEMFSPRERG